MAENKKKKTKTTKKTPAKKKRNSRKVKVKNTFLDLIRKNSQKAILYGGTIVTLTVGGMYIGTHYEDILDNVKHEDSTKTGDEIFGTEDKVIKAVMKNDKVDREYTLAKILGNDAVLVVEPTNYTYASIYKTIDAIKKMSKESTIPFPILFNIEPLMQDETLRANCLLAEAFLNKLSDNGFYVGLYGSADSMRKFEEKFREVTTTKSIDSYDKLIVQKNGQEDYKGTYSMIEDTKGEITLAFDLRAIIKKNKLNQASNYVKDHVHKVKKDETLTSIAEQYGIKVSDLAEYNGLESDTKVKTSQSIKVPNRYEKKKIEKQEQVDKQTTNLLKGIDISTHQDQVNWDTLSKEIDFAIVRLCDFCYMREDGTCAIDDQFIRNMQACERLNIPVGVYYFSRATNQQEARQEAQFVAKMLKEYSLELPVYMDIETPTQNKMIDANSVQMKEIVAEAMTELQGEGYYTGVYLGSGTESNTGRRAFISDISKYYTCWVTSGETYDDNINFSEFENNSYPVVKQYLDNADVVQHTQHGKISGINGNCDFNFADPQLIKTIKQNGYAKPKRN